MKKKPIMIISCILSILSIAASIGVFLLQMKMNTPEKGVIGGAGGIASLFITTPFGTITTYPIVIYLITLLLCIITAVLIVSWKKNVNGSRS